MTSEIRPASSNVFVGALWLLGAVTAFSGMDALAKLLVEDYSVVQVLWARYIFFLLPLCLAIKPARWVETLRSDRPWLQIGRGMMPVLASLVLVIGFITLPLADATAILFAAPFIVTILAGPMLGERVGAVRWLAVVLGFVGVVIVARPGSGLVGWAALWPLTGALFFALFHIMTRMLARTADALTTLAYTALVGAVVTTVAVAFFWTPPTTEGWSLFIASGLLFGLGHFLVIKALEYAEASALAPFNYTQIIVATVLGVLMFGDVPDAVALLGMAVIVGAGLFVFVQQRRSEPA